MGARSGRGGLCNRAWKRELFEVIQRVGPRSRGVQGERRSRGVQGERASKCIFQDGVEKECSCSFGREMKTTTRCEYPERKRKGWKVQVPLRRDESGVICSIERRMKV